VLRLLEFLITACLKNQNTLEGLSRMVPVIHSKRLQSDETPLAPIFSSFYLKGGLLQTADLLVNLQHSIKKTSTMVCENFHQTVFCGESTYKMSAWAKFWLEFGVLSSLSFKINFQGIRKSWELYFGEIVCQRKGKCSWKRKEGEG